MSDLRDGFYDDDIDELIYLYHYAKCAFGAAGYYVNGNVVTENMVFDELGYTIPDRIYKK